MTEFNITNNSDNTINITVKCPFCGAYSTIQNISKSDFIKYQKGELVQRAFPNMNSTNREMLITGMCITCQNSTFGNDDE